MKRLWSLLIALALVGAGFVAWDLATSQANELYRLGDLVAFAFLCSGVTLLALWTAHGSTRWAWRVAGLLTIAALLIWFVAVIWQEAWVLVLIGLTQGLSILVAIPCLRLLVFFVPGSPTSDNQVPPARSGSKQVALRDLVSWVAAAACLLGALRFLEPDTLPGSAYTVISIRGICFALVGLTVYWALVGRRNFSLRVVTVAFVAPLLGAIASWCTFLSRPPGDPGWRWFVLMTTFQAACTAAMLSLWQRGGHAIEVGESVPDRSNLQAQGSPVAP